MQVSIVLIFIAQIEYTVIRINQYKQKQSKKTHSGVGKGVPLGPVVWLNNQFSSGFLI